MRETRVGEGEGRVIVCKAALGSESGSFQPRASSLTFNAQRSAFGVQHSSFSIQHPAFSIQCSVPGKAKIGFVRFRSWRQITARVWGLAYIDSLLAPCPSMPLADDRDAAYERHTVRYDDVSPQLLMHSMHIDPKG